VNVFTNSVVEVGSTGGLNVYYDDFYMLDLTGVYFSKEEKDRAEKILRELNLNADPDVIFIDARVDNTPSEGSCANQIAKPLMSG
jgi:ABC-type Fe3+-hydroxamate transport system substrate-binding protein